MRLIKVSETELFFGITKRSLKKVKEIEFQNLSDFLQK